MVKNNQDLASLVFSAPEEDEVVNRKIAESKKKAAAFRKGQATQKKSVREELEDYYNPQPKEAFNPDTEDLIDRNEIGMDTNDDDFDEEATQNRVGLLRAEQEMDEKYVGKKIGRKDLYEDQGAPEDEESEEGEEGFEMDFEDDNEEGMDDDEELDEDEVLQNLNLLDEVQENYDEEDQKVASKQKNSKAQNKRVSFASRIHYDDGDEKVFDGANGVEAMDENDEDQEVDEEDDDNDLPRKKIDEDEEILSKALKKMEEEDQQQAKKIQFNKEEELARAQHTVNLKKLIDTSLNYRILLQKMLTASNKMPQELNYHDFFDAKIQQIHENAKEKTLSMIANLTEVQIHLGRDNHSNLIHLEKVKTSPQVWHVLNENFNKILPTIEETIDKWNTQTQLYSNKSLSKNLRFLNQSIVHQVKKTLENHEPIIKKIQLKRSVYRVLGKRSSTMSEEYDENIYDDSDFYQSLLKDYLSSASASTQEGGDGEDGVDFELTRKFLEERKNRKKLEKKDVDRKASKNRKLRFHIHEKIVNFMNPVENFKQLQGKERILMNLFGVPTTTAPADKNADTVYGDIELI